MSGGKRKSEGIALLSLYNDADMDQDDEGDSEMEMEEEAGREEEEANRLPSPSPTPSPLPTPTPTPSPLPSSSSSPSPSPSPLPLLSPSPPLPQSIEKESFHEEKEKEKETEMEMEKEKEGEEMEEEGGRGEEEKERFLTPLQNSPPLSVMPSGAPSYSIVDYAHDEAPQSPGFEEGEIWNVGSAIFGRDLQQANNGAVLELTSTMEANSLAPSMTATVQPEELDQPAGVNDIVSPIDMMEVGAAEATNSKAIEQDPLAGFLPPPPAEKCSDELQNKFIKYLALKNAGRSFNEELQKSKGYRNPDFLQRAVKYQGIDQIGSCFRKEVFDPNGYDPSDFYDALALEFKRELERKERERKQSQRVDGAHGGIYSVSTIVPSIPASTDTTGKVEGRTNKKSKWDKVDGDGKVSTTLVSSGTKDVMVAASTTAAFLTAKAGAGYASFAQQRRREVEERAKPKEKPGFK